MTRISKNAVASTPPTDLNQFGPVVEAALAAFNQDVSYVTAMAAAARVITRKREAWQVSQNLRSA